VATIPPYLMVGVRFVIAGTGLYAWVRVRGAPRPTAPQWRNAAVLGGLMLVLGIGTVSWAEQRVPSGLTALIVATVPLWLVVFHWLSGGPRPGPVGVLGIAVGFAGVGLLVQPGAHGGVDPVGAGVLCLSTISWSIGTLYGRRADLPESPLLTTGMEMLAGGVMNIAVGVAAGETARLHLAAISAASLFGLAYLIVFGSIIAYSAYTYLVSATTPARLGTYAYVNPVIAILLGWLVRGEPIGPRTLLAMAIIIGAVVLLTLSPQPVSESAHATR
jgi:drug/metabolite transporter (DMT)-like permease